MQSILGFKTINVFFGVFLLVFLNFCELINKNYHSPKFILWAWERNENLNFIDSKKVGIAYLSLTIQIKKDKIIKRPRLNLISFPSDTYTFPVIRIEATNIELSRLDKDLISQITIDIYNLTLSRGIKKIQIDFEVTKSQRGFYKALLADLRKKIIPRIEISITGLASWCFDDNWIQNLEVEEVVPMLFDLGYDKNVFINKINRGEYFTEELCRKAVGISTRQSNFDLPKDLNIYIFSPEQWNHKSYETIIQKLKR